MPMRLINLTPIQIKCLNDEHRFIVTPAGRRSRKTLIFKRKLLQKAMRSDDNRYFYGAPTHTQAKNIFWNDLKKNTALIRIDKSETAMMVKLINGSEIHVVGLDKPERIEGQPWNGCHITEIGNVKAEAWPENIRPVLSDTNGFAYLDGVPEGMNHYYDLALRSANGVLPRTKAGIGSFAENTDKDFLNEDGFPEWAYYHWFSSDVLSAGEIASAKADLDERTFKQEYEGSFETYEGLAYVEFGKHNLAMVQQRPGHRIHVGMDFNINPMTATIGHIIGDTYEQFAEIYQNRSRTSRVIETLLDRYPDTGIEIFPDSTGKRETSNANESDLALLRRAGFKVTARAGNPFQIDRVNAVNSLVKKRDNIRYKVNPETCPKTVNDFNKVEALSDGRLNRDQEKKGLKHISDGLGYLITYNWPVKEREVYIAA